jgi:hypothetical protein
MSRISSRRLLLVLAGVVLPRQALSERQTSKHCLAHCVKKVRLGTSSSPTSSSPSSLSHSTSSGSSGGFSSILQVDTSSSSSCSGGFSSSGPLRKAVLWKNEEIIIDMAPKILEHAYSLSLPSYNCSTPGLSKFVITNVQSLTQVHVPHTSWILLFFFSDAGSIP